MALCRINILKELSFHPAQLVEIATPISELSHGPGRSFLAAC
jgi:hypothetical protein